jgi:hypothetical protein
MLTREVFEPVYLKIEMVKKWATIKKSIAALDPALSARDDKEEARVGNSDPG